MAVTEHVIAADDDATLVSAVQAGDIEAYTELFRRHHTAVRRACARRLRDPADAEEVAQAAFVRALERIDRCGGERRFGAWVHVIAQRLCIDVLRSQARTTPREDPLDGEREVGPNTPEERALSADTAATMRAALSTLPPRQRDIVIARDVEERRPPEIAAAFGLSIGAVDSLLLRARRRLAGAYRAAGGEQGLSTTASSAAVAGGTIVAGNRGVPAAVVAGVRSIRDAVAQVSGMVASAPVASTAPPGAGRAAAAAVAVALSLAGVPAHRQATPDVAAVRDAAPVPVAVPIPALPAPAPPATPAPPAPPHLGGAVPAPLPSPAPPALEAHPVPTAPAAPGEQAPAGASLAPVAPIVGTVDDVVTGLTEGLGQAVAGAADTLSVVSPVG